MDGRQRVQRRYVPHSPDWITLQKAVEYVRKHRVTFERAEQMYGIPKSTMQRHYSSKYGSKPRSTIDNIQASEGTVFVSDAKDATQSQSDLPIDEFEEIIEKVNTMDDDEFGEYFEGLCKDGCVMDDVDEDGGVNQLDL